MTKIAFMFPGQGSFQRGMGREIAEAVPEAMAVYDEGSEASGLDLRAPLLRGHRRGADADRAAAARARCDEPRDQRRSAQREASTLTTSIGHSVGEFSALGAADSLGVRETIALVRERGLATAAAARLHPGSMAAILGLADEAVEALCRKIAQRLAGELQLPRAARHLRRDGRRRRVLLAGAQRRCGARRPAQGVGSLPLAARRARGRAACARRSSGSTSRRRPRSSSRRSPRGSRTPSATAASCVEQLTAPVRFTQAARELIEHGVTDFVEVGPGSVLSGLLKRIDSSVRTIAVNDLKSLDAAVHELG